MLILWLILLLILINFLLLS